MSSSIKAVRTGAGAPSMLSRAIGTPSGDPPAKPDPWQAPKAIAMVVAASRPANFVTMGSPVLLFMVTKY
ncbi:hypothetical protein [Microvirga aerophila]|uniref:hypothetical protein n=1 Tax=Microvirga aerophila TaxID=670291 RepID=UPI0013B41562|nr:hypothetical protein [Microvirga aerophila]